MINVEENKMQVGAPDGDAEIAMPSTSTLLVAARRDIFRRRPLKERLKLTKTCELLRGENRRLLREVRVLSRRAAAGKRLNSKLVDSFMEVLLKNCIYDDSQPISESQFTTMYQRLVLCFYFCDVQKYKLQADDKEVEPSVLTLLSLVRQWRIKPGINTGIFDALSVKLISYLPEDRHCVLCIDEIELKSRVSYDVLYDEIIGFEDTSGEKSTKPANNALVVMARGIASNWELPLCYYFLETSCTTDILKSVVFKVTRRLRSCGATVHALITSVKSNFVQLSRELGISIENPVFSVDDFKMIYIFDAPSLMTKTRDNLFELSIEFGDKLASWHDIIQFYIRDSQQRMRTAPRLSKHHIGPTGFYKSKVSYAIDILSNCVAAGMRSHLSLGLLRAEAVGTIDFVDHFDKLFEILNSSDESKSKKYGKVYTGSKEQIQFFEETLQFLKSLNVIEEKGSPLKGECFEYWQITIRSVMLLWEKLRSHNFLFLCTQQINLACVAKFFDLIRQQNDNCLINPTPAKFIDAYRELFSARLVERSDNLNYTAIHDDDRIIDLIITFLRSTSFVPLASHPILELLNYSRNLDPPMKTNFRDICKYLFLKCKTIHLHCKACAAYFNGSGAVLGNIRYENLYIPDDFYYYIYRLNKIFVKNFEYYARENIGDGLFKLAQTEAFRMSCPDFPRAYLIKLFLYMRILVVLLKYNIECDNISRENRNPLRVAYL